MSDLTAIGVSVQQVSDQLLEYSRALHALSERIRAAAARAAQAARAEGGDSFRAGQTARSLEVAARECARAAASLEAASRAARQFVVRNVAADGHGTSPSSSGAAVAGSLSDADAAALADYTGDGYKDMDQALWGTRPLTPGAAERIVSLSRALRKLPDYRGTVLRGAALDDDQLARYVPGATVTHHAFTSADRVAPFKGNVVFLIQSLHGKSIRSWSSYRDREDEVLFDRGTRFTVIDRWMENGIYRIELQEAE
jgi:hypothetical protein